MSTTVAAQVRQVAGPLREVATGLALLSDEDLIDGLAAEVAERSRRELGQDGLAARLGHGRAIALPSRSFDCQDAAMNTVAFVTGGSRGIGAATAVALADAGHDIAISWRARSDRADEVADRCRALGVRATAIRCDVADPDDIARAFVEVDRLGPLAVVVNNAGVVSPAGRVDGFDAARIDRVLAVNVRGAFLVAGEAVRRMSTAHGGAGGVLVNVSSRAAVLGGSGEYVDYAASKAAVDALTIGLAREVAAEGIRVVGVRPGLIATEIHAAGRLDAIGATPPLSRPGTAREVAATIAWLASPAASYITGTTVDVAGGR